MLHPLPHSNSARTHCHPTPTHTGRCFTAEQQPEIVCASFARDLTPIASFAVGKFEWPLKGVKVYSVKCIAAVASLIAHVASQELSAAMLQGLLSKSWLFVDASIYSCVGIPAWMSLPSLAHAYTAPGMKQRCSCSLYECPNAAANVQILFQCANEQRC